MRDAQVEIKTNSSVTASDALANANLDENRTASAPLDPKPKGKKFSNSVLNESLY